MEVGIIIWATRKLVLVWMELIYVVLGWALGRTGRFGCGNDDDDDAATAGTTG